MRASPSYLALFSALLASVLAACGGPPAESAPTRMPTPEREPTTVAEAQARIARAEEMLAGVAAPRAAQVESADSGSANRSVAADPCSERCRALTSMRSAVAALCRMTGDLDPRCDDARKTLTDNEARVGACGC
ncbi:MAG: hypothetical protein JWP97_5197 [Labilithrix sp.]|nr:hypothetical protein [Labilithrix sp.]